jgi:hypothetical protein
MESVACRFLVAVALPAAACSAAPSLKMAPGGPALIAIPAEPQRDGDAAAGYAALLNKGYVTCGMPWSVYAQIAGPTPPELLLPGRAGHNAELPYNQNAVLAASGVEVVSANCLTCHAGRINNQLVIGLGAADGDFTVDVSAPAGLAQLLTTDPAEKAEVQKFAARVRATAPYTVTSTVGVNPADNLAAVLFAHRDAPTLAWSDTPLIDLPPATVVPVDVPPWWRMKKKNAMFYDAGGRGDQATLMMTSSALCTDSRDEAAAIDAWFNDVRAYLLSSSRTRKLGYAPAVPWQRAQVRV